MILPVMGRSIYHNSNKWQYYTMSDKTNAIKLPMSHNGRSCTSEYGCDELSSGDTVYVEGYNDAFKLYMKILDLDIFRIYNYFFVTILYNGRKHNSKKYNTENIISTRLKEQFEDIKIIRNFSKSKRK